VTRLNVRCVFLTETHFCSVLPQIIHNFKPDQEMLEKFCTSFESKSCPRYQQIIDFARTDPKQSQAIVNKIQNINTNTINAQLTFNEQVTKSFNDARSLVQTHQISDDDKDTINSRLSALETELKKEPQNREQPKIKRFYEWLKNNANWLVPTISSVLTEVLK